MTKWIRIVETRCSDKMREAEFNDWYSCVHLDDMLKCPVVVAAKRYQRMDPKEGEAEYLAIYEIETEDIEKGMETYTTHVQSLREKGRISDLVEVVSLAIFKQV